MIIDLLFQTRNEMLWLSKYLWYYQVSFLAIWKNLEVYKNLDQEFASAKRGWDVILQDSCIKVKIVYGLFCVSPKICRSLLCGSPPHPCGRGSKRKPFVVPSYHMLLNFCWILVKNLNWISADHLNLHMTNRSEHTKLFHFIYRIKIDPYSVTKVR